eukprot:scaffold1452_cov117-Isochrysis_galbana.AAC.10
MWKGNVSGGILKLEMRALPKASCSSMVSAPRKKLTTSIPGSHTACAMKVATQSPTSRPLYPKRPLCKPFASTPSTSAPVVDPRRPRIPQTPT